MVTHSRVLAWRIPGTGEPGGLPLWSHSRTRLKQLSSSISLVVLTVEASKQLCNSISLLDKDLERPNLTNCTHLI